MLSGGSARTGGAPSSKDKAWSTEEVQLLIKAVNLFPAGTNDRCSISSLYLWPQTLSDITAWRQAIYVTP